MLIFMSRRGHWDKGVWWRAPAGDKLATSCSNLERSEARQFRSRVQGRMEKEPGPGRRHIPWWSGAGDRTQLSAPSQAARGVRGSVSFRQHVTLSEISGNSSGNPGKAISLNSPHVVSDSLFENKTPAPGKGKLIGSRRPQTWAGTRVARTGGEGS